VVAHSDDPSPYMIGNEFHYDDRYSYRGQLESDPIGYFAWLLLLVIATNGQRYALQKRMHVRSGRLGPLLAVTIKEDKPTDVDVEWKHTAKKPALTLADAASQATGLSPGLDFSGLPAGIADRLSALGFATDGVPAQAAPPDPTVDLSRLEQLRATGVLTDEEYQAERSRIIANI
ncbi:MAG: SHOCT domain-containing protein, partial [Frankiaceae bacterium]|nr:SHOCT domain-containing protein [Frankiaceae bacterium]